MECLSLFSAPTFCFAPPPLYSFDFRMKPCFWFNNRECHCFWYNNMCHFWYNSNLFGAMATKQIDRVGVLGDRDGSDCECNDSVHNWFRAGPQWVIVHNGHRV